MNDIIFTPKEETWSFLKKSILIFLFIISFHPFLKVSAQEEGKILVKPKHEHKYILGPQLMPVSSDQENDPDNPIPLILQTSCPNSNFSAGTFANWTGCYGTFISPNYPPNAPGVLHPCITPGFAYTQRRHVIEVAPGYKDPYSCDTINTTYPGEAFSARLGDTSGGGHAEQLKYDVTIAADNYLFIYRYAVVLESPNHIPSEQPGFTIQVQDLNGNLIDSCGYFSFTAPPCPYPPNCQNVAGWRYCPGVGYQGDGCYYKNWTTVGMNLSNFVSLGTVRIVFTTRGCSFTAHRGYAYISAYCSALLIQTSLCEGQDSAILTAPPGFSYYWTAISGDPSINGDTTASITVPSQEGATYNCHLTAVNGCTVDVINTLHYTQIHTGFTETMNCAQRPSHFFDTTWVSQNQVHAWRWFFGDPASGSSDSSHLKNPNHSFTAPGNYNVTLISYSTEGCPDTATKLVEVDTLVTINNTMHRSQICSNQYAIIILTTNVSNALFTWTATASSGTITGFSNNATPAPSPIDQILVNNGTQIDSVTYIITPHKGTCTGDPFTYVVVVHPLPTATITGTIAVCKNSTSPLITFTGASGTAPYTFTYNINGLPNQTVTTTVGNSVTIAAPTNTVGTFIYNLVSVQDGSSTICSQSQTGSAVVTVNPLPTATITGTIAVCQNAASPLITFTGASATAPYTFTYNINGGANQLITTTVGNSVTIAAPTNVVGTFNYNLVSVHDGSSTACSQAQTGSAVVTVNPLPTATITGTIAVCQNSTPPLITFTGASTTPPYTFTYNINGLPVQTVTTTVGNSVTVAAPTNTVGTFTYNLVSVQDGSSTTCSQPQTGSAVVTVNPLPTATITGTIAVCQNSPSPLITFTGASTTPPYTFTYNINGLPVQTVTTTVGNSVTVAAPTNTVGTFTYNLVSVQDGSSTACSQPQTGSAVVTVNPLPTATISGTIAVCQNSTSPLITFTGASSTAPYTFTYNINGLPVQTVTTIVGNSVTVAAPTNTVGTFTYNLVSVQDGSSTVCSQSQTGSAVVTVNPLPVITIAGPGNACALSTGNVYTTQAGMSNYQWLVSAGGVITAGGTNSSSSVTVTWNTTGTQTVSVNYHDGNGCTALASTSYTVTVNVLPVPTISGATSVCMNSTTVYTTEAGMSNYTWTVTAGGNIVSGANTNTVNIHWTANGSNTITVNYLDPNGCTAVTATSYTVNVTTLPVPSLTGLNAICSGFSATYTTDPGMSNYSWTITSGGTVTAGGGTTDNIVTIFWTTPGVQIVTVNYTVGPGCAAPSPTVLPVTVNSLPVPAISGSNVLCSGTTGVVYSTLPGMTNYQWVISAGGTITAGGGVNDNTVTVTWNTPGAKTVSLNYHDLNGCTAVSPTIYNVTVNPLPTPTITGLASVCLNFNSTYTTEAGMTNYSWTVSAGGTITTGAGTNAVTINWTTTGAKTVTANYFNGFNCTAQSATIYPVTVNPLPNPTLTGTTSICTGFSATYTTEAGMLNYTWLHSPGGTVTAGGGNTNNTMTVLWTTVGPQSVSVNYFLSTGCTAGNPTILSVTVNSSPVVTIAGTPVVCAGTTGVVYGTQAGMSNYQWTVSQGGTVTAGGTPSNNTVTVTWTTPGAQTVTVNYNDANGCSAVSPTMYQVTVNPLPVPGISGPASVCLNSSGIYSTETGMSNYLWSVSAGGTITSGTGTNSINILWSTIGAKTITVNYHDANGCTAATPSSLSVNVSTLPVPSLNGSNLICTGTSITYTTDAGMNNYSWVVSAGGTVTAGGGTSDNFVTVLWNTAGMQTVTVNYTMGTGCTASAPTVLNVTVKPRPSITNAATSTLCSSGTTNIVFTSTLAGTTYTWSASGSSGNVSGYSNGSGGIIIQTLVNAGFNIETVTYAVTPSLNGCDGPIANFIVTVNPVADVYFTPNGQSFCTGGTTNISIASHVTGTTFTWVASGSSINITGFGPGNTNLISQTLTNSGNYPGSVTYTVSPIANSCPGTNNSVVVNVNPFPATSYTPCNDIITTPAAQPIKLKGGLPLGGTYSGTGVNTGIFYPSIAGIGNQTITYSYTNTWGCVANATQVISVINPPVFLCDNTMTDIRDNQTYTTVKIGTQCWMAENLNYGNLIVSTQMQRDNCISEKYCFSDIPANCTSYGGLYQWDELMQYDNVAAAQGFCPPGWHIPTENDWTTLFDFYISNGFAGSPLKYTGYSGFDVFLSGTRFNNVNWNFSNFAVMFWSSTKEGNDKAWAHGMNTFNPSVSYYPSSRTHAFNVRCIKD